MGRRAVTLVWAAACLAWAPAAEAYVRTVTSTGAPMYWNRTVLTIHAYVGDPPAPLTSEDVGLAVRGAASAWSRDRVSCTSMELRVVNDPRASAPVALDGVSRLTFRRESWCKEPRVDEDSCYDPFALAVTSVFARKVDGEIVDADIELNAANFEWADLVRKPEPDRVLQDLQNTLTHELGHYIGLDHTCFLAAPRDALVDDRGRPVPNCAEADDAVRATTMFAAVIPGDLERRTLAPDDHRALCEVYRPIDLLLESWEPAGCAVARARPPAPAAWAAGALALVLIGRRRRTAPPATGCRSSTDRAPRR